MANKKITYEARPEIVLDSIESLEESARKLLVKESIASIAKKYISDEDKQKKLLLSLKNKGNIGHIIEAAFGISTNSAQLPDFTELGVEVKASPVERGTKTKWKAGERLVITMINYNPTENEKDGNKKEFEETVLFEKLKHILLCLYIRPHNHKGMYPGDYKIENVVLFSPPEEDLPIIKKDWEKIMTYVYSGHAEELSESLTEYLGACTKGASGKLKKQGYYPFLLAKPRAFCLKTSYMTYLHNIYIMQGKDTDEHAEKIGGIDFEKIAIERFSMFIGKLDVDIAAELSFNLDTNVKNIHSMLSFSMIGLKSNCCEEFKKANIVLKTLRFETSGMLKESISLPVSDFLSVLDEESFEDSALCDYFERTRFLLSIWKKEKIKGKEYCRFMGASFWGMDGKDIYGPLAKCWEDTKSKLTHGVSLIPEFTGGVWIVYNDLPKISDKGAIAHVRPHSRVSYHEVRGKIYANKPEATRAYAFELPNGDWMAKQSFWLNSKYMVNIVKKMGII